MNKDYIVGDPNHVKSKVDTKPLLMSVGVCFR